jgi:nucleoside-diphosphate kinase
MRKERTLVIIKPDGVQRGLIGDIITRFEKMGLKIVGTKMIIPTKDLARKHYTMEDDWVENVGKKTIEAGGDRMKDKDPIEEGEKILSNITGYITSGPVVVMVWQGVHAVEMVRKMVGGTEPRTSDVGTIRGDYVLDSYEIADEDGRAVRNIIHASSATSEADNEINLWFDKSEVMDYKLVQDIILYDTNLDGLVE